MGTGDIHPLLDHHGPIAIAHRGGSLEGEENTLPAFAHAVALGYSHLETDVHLTRDGEVVIHHDPTLQRMTGDPRAIAEMTWHDLQAVRTPQGASVPRLSNLLEEYPDQFINIEPKSDTVVTAMAEVIRRMGALSQIGVGSFDVTRTNRLRSEFGPALCWSPARLAVFGLWLQGWRLPLWMGRYPMVQVPRRYHGIPLVTRRFIRAAHRHGVRVQVWTVDDPTEMHRLLDMGVDALMTDRPTVLKQVLMQRNAWRGTDGSENA